MSTQPRIQIRDETTSFHPDPWGLVTSALLRSRWWIAGFLFLGIAGGFVYGALQPNTFDSSGKLLIRPGAREEATTDTTIEGGGRTTISGAREAVVNEMHILRNPVVFEKTVRIVGLDKLFKPYDPLKESTAAHWSPTYWMHALQSWWFVGDNKDELALPKDLDADPITAASAILQKRIEMVAEPYSSIITVNYTANHASVARDVVNAFLEAAGERHAEVFATDTTFTFIQEQYDKALKDSSEADQKLMEYRVEHNIFDVVAQKTEVHEEIGTLERQVGQNKQQLAASQKYAEYLRNEIAKEPEYRERPLPQTPIAHPGHAQLQEKIYELIGESAAVGTTTISVDRQAGLKTAIENALKELRGQLENTPAWIEPTPYFDKVPNTRYERLQLRLDETTEILMTLESSTGVLEARIKDLQDRLDAITAAEPEHRWLLADAEQKRAAAARFRETRDRFGVMNLLDQVKMSNLKILEHAVLPLTKSGPKRGKHLLMGTVLGGLLGFSLALLRQLLDSRLRRAVDVRRALGTPVLETVPYDAAMFRDVARLRSR